MSAHANSAESFVIFPLGRRRFALPTSEVVELTRTGLVQKFPHKTRGLPGVLMRRGDVLPVWDVTQPLLGPVKERMKFWLVTRRNFAGQELTAIPVSGECQMLSAEMQPAPEGAAQHVRGALLIENQLIEVIDLARLAVPGMSEATASGKKQ